MTEPVAPEPEEDGAASGLLPETDDLAEPHLRTFDEMLPAVRAFYRKSSKP